MNNENILEKTKGCLIHKAVTVTVQKKLEQLGFEYRSIGKYLDIKSLDLFVCKSRKQKNKYFIGIGRAAVRYGWYVENEGMVKNITKKEFNGLKDKLMDLSNFHNLWL